MKSKRQITNPAWLNAPYEVEYSPKPKAQLGIPKVRLAEDMKTVIPQFIVVEVEA